MTQSLADFRGQISLPSKFPSLKGPAQCLWVSFSLSPAGCSGTSDLACPVPFPPALQSAPGWLDIPTSVPLLPGVFSVLHHLPKLGLPAPTGPLFQASCLPPSLPLKCSLSISSLPGQLQRPPRAGTCLELPISEGTKQRTQICEPSAELPDQPHTVSI